MKKLAQLLLIALCLGIALLSFAGCEEDSNAGSIVGAWQSGNTKLYFYSDDRYIMLINDRTFDSGTYTTNGSRMTMTSRTGRSTSTNYTISNDQLIGFTDGYGNRVIYHRI